MKQKYFVGFVFQFASWEKKHKVLVDSTWDKGATVYFSSIQMQYCLNEIIQSTLSVHTTSVDFHSHEHCAWFFEVALMMSTWKSCFLTGNFSECL